MDDSERYDDVQTFITCPYNVAHSCPKFRMARHLLKCRKQHVEEASKKCVCPFNATHLVAQIELEFHEEICPDREIFYNYYHKPETSQNKVVDELQPNKFKKVEIPSSENWDDEIDNDRNIVEECRRRAEERGVLQSNSNAPPAERKALRSEQRMKTRERMNAEEEKKRMFDDVPEDTRSIASSRSTISRVTDYSLNTAHTNTHTIGRIPASEKGRGRGSNVQKQTPVEMGFGRGSR